MDGYIVITGAAGMIGSGVVRYLNDLGNDHLLLVDDLKKTEKWKNLVGKRFKNLISRHKVFDYLRSRDSEIKAVIHLGACSNTMERDASYLMENNFHFSVELAEWALTKGKRFIYASSAATYGDGSLGFADDERFLDQLRPINMYAFSKHLFDLWIQREGGLNSAVGLKYFNVFGPNEYHKDHMGSMVLQMLRPALNTGVIKLYKSNDLEMFGHGEQKRDFIYLKDVVQMTCSFLDGKCTNISGLYNIGMGVATTWNRLAHSLAAALHQKLEIVYIDMPEGLSAQYQNYTCADMKKFKRVFPEFVNTSIEDAVCEYVQKFLLKNERW